VIVRWFRRIITGLACLSALLLCSALILRKSADSVLYPARDGGVRITVVDHGYHAGIVLPRGLLAELAETDKFANLRQALDVFSAFDHVEIGWGEENFYRFTPVAELSAAPQVARALFNPGNRSVLHVVGVNGDPATVFSRSAPLSFIVSREGMRRIARELDRQLAPSATGEVVPQGPGLYGPSAFFNARDGYHLFNTCNHWAGRTLALAGLPYYPVESTISAGLMMRLRRAALNP
jgi:uncharacterized protein (TIGR02117 family)